LKKPTIAPEKPAWRPGFIPHSEFRAPHWPERLTKTAEILLRRSSRPGKVLNHVFERLTKNPGNFIKMPTKSKMLTQIPLRTPTRRGNEMSCEPRMARIARITTQEPRFLRLNC
jgi:hypothetical protein